MPNVTVSLEQGANGDLNIVDLLYAPPAASGGEGSGELRALRAAESLDALRADAVQQSADSLEALDQLAGEIDRGYERIDERLRALGASIERV